MMASAIGLKAQDCDAILLPYFNNNREALENMAAAKLDQICRYARNAFYESDTIPAGAHVMPITDVKDKLNNVPLPANLVVNLETLSYYQYNFGYLQRLYPKPDAVICFTTPSSTHPYLVLRSIDEMYYRTEYPENYE